MSIESTKKSHQIETDLDDLKQRKLSIILSNAGTEEEEGINDAISSLSEALEAELELEAAAPLDFGDFEF